MINEVKAALSSRAQEKSHDRPQKCILILTTKIEANQLLKSHHLVQKMHEKEYERKLEDVIE